MNASPPPDRYAVVGYPVQHSWSPFIHAMFAKQTSQAMTYNRLEIAPENFVAEVQRFFEHGGKGLNITLTGLGLLF
jgi:shikimate dehydrogenase